jgi:putative ABC transport system permease protein
MYWIALKMLVGDKAKYYGSIAGVTFAALLIGQQTSIFCGLMLRTTSQIQDIADADVWIMDPAIQYVDELKPIKEDCLQEVRGIPGVAWAVHFYKGQARMKIMNGRYQQCLVLGMDDASLVGAPREIIAGSLGDLRQPDAVIMDEAGYKYLWPGEEYRLGRTFEMNDHRAILVGICKASKTFSTFPVLYTRYYQALQFSPQERRWMTFVLVKLQQGASAKEVCAEIKERTKLLALTRDDFGWRTIDHYLKRTSIPQNFAITILLGFVVGCAIAGQTFYSFVLDNLNQFGSLKAMGVTNGTIVGMVLLQGSIIGAIGFCLGIGLANLFGVLTANTQVSFLMPWQVPVLTAGSVALIVILASLISIRRVLTLEPAVVFQGAN